MKCLWLLKAEAVAVAVEKMEVAAVGGRRARGNGDKTSAKHQQKRS
jgi:hypothetical protein